MHNFFIYGSIFFFFLFSFWDRDTTYCSNNFFSLPIINTKFVSLFLFAVECFIKKHYYKYVSILWGPKYLGKNLL